MGKVTGDQVSAANQNTGVLVEGPREKGQEPVSFSNTAQAEHPCGTGFAPGDLLKCPPVIRARTASEHWRGTGWHVPADWGLAAVLGALLPHLLHPALPSSKLQCICRGKEDFITQLV